MRRCIVIVVLLLINQLANSQERLITSVPQEPVVVGEPFVVQYVAEKANEFEAKTPNFDGFRVVHYIYYASSNHIQYNGRSIPSTQNLTFTLEALHTGRVRIPGTIATIDGKQYESEDAWVMVISRAEAIRRQQQNGGVQDDLSIFFLKPGEEPYKRIKKDLFVKVSVDKHSCFVGEPVVATFKLYSRLRSRSDIIKNPGFYGFSVHDMISLGDKQIATEVIDGRPFDVHTIRQVQLYPLQEGTYNIEPMEIKNHVEFYRRKLDTRYSFGEPRAEVREGVIKDPSAALPAGVEAYENNISTPPVSIVVKPLPAINKPADFNGATGNFSVTALLDKNSLAKNEEGHLTLTIKGAGNFNQLSAPTLQWPDGIEAFEPVISDLVDRKHAPLMGQKTFRFAFVSAKAGNYQLPAISFSFFDPVTKSYKKLSTAAQQVLVTQAEKTIARVPTIEKKVSIEDSNRKASIIAGSIIIAAILIALGYWLTRKKEKPAEPVQTAIDYKTPAELLTDVHMMLPAASSGFYRTFQRAIWDFFRQHFDFAGSGMNKESLSAKLRERKVDPQLTERVMQSLQQCETGIYTGLEQGENREALLQGVKDALEQIHSYLVTTVDESR